MLRITSLIFALLVSWSACAQVPLTGAGKGAPSGGSVPFGIAFIGTNNSVVAGASFSFVAQGIGTAGATRIVAVGITHGVTVGITVTAVTIGGVSATQATGGGGVSGVGTNTDIWYAAVPTGTTATIAVTLSASQSRLAIDVYSVVGTGAAFSSGANNGSTSAATLSATATVPAGGGAIGVLGVHASGSAGTVTGTNLTIDQNGVAFGNSIIGAGSNTTASGSTAFTFTWTGTIDAAMSIATFTP